MTYFITFSNSRKPIILDDVKTFVLLGDLTSVKFYDGSTESLFDVLGISAHDYEEG
jgi:hypothetical protein